MIVVVPNKKHRNKKKKQNEFGVKVRQNFDTTKNTFTTTFSTQHKTEKLPTVRSH